MAIYISKSALDKIPSKNFLSSTSMKGIYLLKTELFASSKELVTLIENPYKTIPVQKNDPRINVVRRIKTSLNIIDQIPSINYSLPVGFSMNSEFDDITEQAVKVFQNLKDLEENGIVDALTLSKMDMALADTVFDLKKGVYLGSKSNRDDQYIGFSDEMDANGLYTYTLKYYNEQEELKTLEIKDKSIHYVQILDDVDNDYYTGFPVSGTNKLVDQHLDVSKNKYNDRSVFLRKKNEKKVKVFAPVRLPDSQLYEIKSNDNITSIIQQHYYIDHDIVFKNIEGVDIIKIPKKEFRNANDTRSKFYMLLLYFYNLNSKNQEGPIKINGLVKNKAFYDKLNSVFIHENKNPLNQNIYSTSKLPNFYSFLRNIDQYSNFSSTQFTLTPGQTIVIPPKGFAEMLYYHLNFNPDLMLSGGNYTTSLSSTLKNEIAQEIQNRQAHQETFLDLLNDTYDQAAARIVSFYEETLKFFKDSYSYIVSQIGQYWPRGTGAHFKAGGSITWGIPIKTGFEAEFFMWRGMTPRDEIKICISQKGKFEVGLDTGLEAGVGIGVGATKRNKKVNAGLYLQTGAQLSIMPYIEGKAEFEFPIKKENTALISMMIAAMGPSTSGVQLSAVMASKILAYFNVVNLDPYQYLTKFNLSAGESIEVEGDTTAVLGVRTENDGAQHADQFVDDNDAADKKESWYSFNELLKYLNFNFQFTADCKLVDIEYTADYTNGVFNPKTLSNAPVKVELQLGNSIAATGQIGDNPGLAKLLDITGISSEAQELSFDRGLLLYTKFNVNMDGLDPQRKIISIDRLYKVGTNTGSVDYLQTGDEFCVLLKRDVLKQIMSDNNYFKPIQAVNMIDSVQYRKKDSIEENKMLLGKEIGRIMAWYESKGIFEGTLKDLVLEKMGIGFNFIYDIDITLKVSGHEKYALIKPAISDLLEFLMWWYRFIDEYSSDQKKILGVQDWLWKQFDAIMNKGKALADDEDALIYICEKIHELVEAVKASTINSPDQSTPWQINLYQYSYDNIQDADVKKKYIRNFISEVFTLALDVANYTMNGINATGWVMDLIFSKLFRYLRNVFEITFALEGGIDLSGTVNAKLSILEKVAFSIDLEGGLFDRTVIKDKNEATIDLNDLGDPLREKFLSIDRDLGTQSRNITDLIFNITK